MSLLYARKLLQYKDFPRAIGTKEFPFSTSTATTNTTLMSETPPSGFNTTVVLTVILTAFFSFSIYLCFISYEYAIERSARRRRHTSSSIASSPPSSSCRRVDPSVVQSLPLFIYNDKEKREEEENPLGLDCAVCLSEFEERETIKMIPHCGHIFHPECIDKWFSCHGSCPLCRTTQLLEGSSSVRNKKKRESLMCSVEEEETSTVGYGDTSVEGQREKLWRMTRTCSWGSSSSSTSCSSTSGVFLKKNLSL